MNHCFYLVHYSSVTSIAVIVFLNLFFTSCSWSLATSNQDKNFEETTKNFVRDSAIVKAELYTNWFFSGEIDSLFSATDEQGKERFSDEESFSVLRSKVLPVLPGFEKELNDSIVKSDSLTSVWKYGINSRDGAVYYIKWNMNPTDHQIIGFAASDAGRVAPSPTENYKPDTKLRLPFEGEWIVFWGGRSIEENYHAAYPRQRFAMDLLPAEDSLTIWRAAKGEAIDLEDFSCFGSPIKAPASGRVVKAVDTIVDNPVRKFHPSSELGNHVIIEHLPGEYSLFAHLRQGSLKAKEGDLVEEGEKIAECGNSGRTTAPHLHYDLINKPEMKRETFSLPALFYDYYADSILIKKGEPARWQRIQNKPQN